MTTRDHGFGGRMQVFWVAEDHIPDGENGGGEDAGLPTAGSDPEVGSVPLSDPLSPAPRAPDTAAAPEFAGPA